MNEDQQTLTGQWVMSKMMSRTRSLVVRPVELILLSHLRKNNGRKHILGAKEMLSA